MKKRKQITDAHKHIKKTQKHYVVCVDKSIIL